MHLSVCPAKTMGARVARLNPRKWGDQRSRAKTSSSTGAYQLQAGWIINPYRPGRKNQSAPSVFSMMTISAPDGRRIRWILIPMSRAIAGSISTRAWGKRRPRSRLNRPTKNRSNRDTKASSSRGRRTECGGGQEIRRAAFHSRPGLSLRKIQQRMTQEARGAHLATDITMPSESIHTGNGF